MPPHRPLLPLLLLLLLPAHTVSACGGETCSCCPPTAPAPVPLLLLSAGSAQVFDGADHPFCAVGWRPAARFASPLGPELLLAAGRHRECYAAAGLFCDIPLAPRLVFSPAFDAGFYDAADGYDLGCAIQFRTSLQLAWSFSSGIRLGLSLSHISNASLGHHNPGTETLSLVLSLPLPT